VLGHAVVGSEEALSVRVRSAVEEHVEVVAGEVPVVESAQCSSPGPKPPHDVALTLQQLLQVHGRK
jgi:hypothetical protein